jgi:hypothetical protein
MAIKILDSVRTQMVDAVVACLSGTSGTAGTIIAGTSGSAGALRVYGGTQPGTAGGTAGTQEILVRIDGLSWGAATNGTATLTASKTGTAGTTGTATWARLSGTNGTGYIIDGVCGTAATSDFVIDAAAISADAVVTLTAATIVQPGS